MARRWPFKQQTAFERFQGWRPTLEKPDRERPADGLPQDIDQHMRLMCDILVLAFQTDTTLFQLDEKVVPYLSRHLAHILSGGHSSSFWRANPVHSSQRTNHERLTCGCCDPQWRSITNPSHSRFPRGARPRQRSTRVLRRCEHQEHGHATTPGLPRFHGRAAPTRHEQSRGSSAP